MSHQQQTSIQASAKVLPSPPNPLFPPARGDIAAPILMKNKKVKTEREKHMERKLSQAWEKSKDLRANASQSERWFWQEIRGKKMGVTFRRQYPCPPYTLDFYCPALKLAIEIDGEQHDPIKDAERDKVISGRGIKTMRFPSIDVTNKERMQEFLEAVWMEIQSRRKGFE